MKKLTRLTLTALLSFFVPLAAWPAPAWGIRLKEITSFEGVRPNQVQGYGLVVGLNGTGDKDKTVFTNQTLATMLRHMDVNINPAAVKVKNVAGVIVTAELPPFVKPGATIDLVVSSLGDASSLQGGTLLTTQLMGVDGKVYVVAQGSLSVGSFAATGQAGNAQRNHPTVGRIVQGGTVEREVPVRWQGRETLSLKLGRPDFTTAARVAEAVNSRLPGAEARPLDSSTIEFNVPLNYRENMALMVAELENLEVEPDAIGQVVIDERTGTVVVGENVRISTVAVAHGNLSVQIKEGQTATQPGPFAMGEPAPEPDLNAEEQADQLLLLERATTIHDLVKALNAIGASPRDLMMIFQAIRAAGALHGELKFM